MARRPPTRGEGSRQAARCAAAEYGQTPGGRRSNNVTPTGQSGDDGVDEELADALDDAVNATDPGQRADKVNGAKAVLGRYKAYLDTRRSSPTSMTILRASGHPQDGIRHAERVGVLRSLIASPIAVRVHSD